ncbi:RNA polymerase subunit sigma [Alicyclobacillus fodiniaquatilis]|uniref:RNA polymerase subunit sigma n=1 Tax=Alicyclobacillus fodiniaquatilis TaxID=1661150 RepID=A0ABW4JD81_9BACL
MLSLALAVSMIRDIVLVTGFVNQSFPQPLDKEEERRCFERWREAQDRQAHDLLVEHNLRLVAHVANMLATWSQLKAL